MIFWEVLWAAVLIGGLAVFAVLAVVVSIRGFADIRSLFKSIEEQHAEEKGEERERD